MVICVVALSLLAGCGGGGSGSGSSTVAAISPKRPAVCIQAGGAAVAHAVGRAAGAVAQAQSTGNNAEPQCSFRAGRLVAVVNVDSSPQPFERLERGIVEATQQFGTVREYAAPQRIAKLGLDASWFPEGGQLLTADSRELLTVAVKWPGSATLKRKALAVALARAYLAQDR